MGKLFVPVEDNLGDLELAYLTLERAVLSEFLVKVQSSIFDAFGESGASDIYNRADHASLRKKFKGPGDPLFYLGSYIEVDESPIRQLLDYSPELRFRAKKARHNRNLWAHYSPPSKREEILEAIAVLKLLSKDLHLPEGEASADAILESLSKISIRRNRLIAGQTITEPTEATVVDETAAIVIDPSAAKEIRPRIGGVWEHELPNTVFQLNAKYRDVLDGNGDSQSWRLGARSIQVLRRWFALGVHAWLWVDLADGATVALIDGDPYLIGYLAEDDPVDNAASRGFYLPQIYENIDGALIDVAAGTPFTSEDFDASELTPGWVEANIPSNSIVQVTDYGDLVVTDDDGSRKVLTLATL
jgi:hypothetical protein